MSTESQRGHRYTRTDLVETALRLLDELGLQDLSMRRLAQELDVQPSALYWHVANKQTLLALVSDQIISRAAAPQTDGLHWKEAAVAQALAIRDALLAYRDGAEVVSSTLALGLDSGEAMKRLMTALTPATENSELIRSTAESVLFLVLGQAWHQQQQAQAATLGVASPAADSWPTATSTADTASVGVNQLLLGLEAMAQSSHASV